MEVLGYWEMILEIFLLWAAYYMVYLLLKGTVAEQVLKGIIIVLAVVMLTRGINLVIINWLLTRLLAISVVAFLILFQPEIRRGLARLGRFGVFSEQREVIGEVAKSSIVLAKRKVGGLIAIEREIGLIRYIESGVSVDSKVTSELINTIFSKYTPLHDGGLIIANQRVEAAACLFPLTQNPNVPKTMGTRHRAAMGLSEETDAVVIVISEETGQISLAASGKINANVDHKSFPALLDRLCIPRIKTRSLSSFTRRILARWIKRQG